MKLAVDLGARNVKVIGMVEDKVHMDTFKSLATTSVFGQKDVVDYKGTQVALGVGDSLIEQDKTERKYIEQTILLAAFKVFSKHDLNNLIIDLGVGLPIHTYKSTKKAKLQLKLDSLVGTDLKGLIDGKPICVKINSAKILAEGYSAFLSVSNEIPKAPTTFIDWGYKTTDVVNLALEDGNWVLQQVHTVPVGIFDILSIMKESLYNNDVDLSQSEIDQYLRTTPVIPSQHGSISLKQYLTKGKPIVDKVFQELKVVMPNILSTNIYMCGGGTDIAQELIGNDYSNIFTLPNEKKSLYANAVGYLLQI